MSKEPLWTDAKIASLTFQNANNLDPNARWMHEQIAKDMRNDYERALAFRNEDIGRLQQALKTLRDQNIQIADNLERVMRERDVAQARIAELEAHLAQTEAILVNTQAQRDIAYQERAEAQQWQQLVADEVHERIGKTIRIENEGRWIELEANDERIGVWLDDFGCAVFRKMRPAE